MITSAQANNFTDTALLKQRFQQAAGKAASKQEVIDRLERMGDNFLALDNSEYDQDKDPGSVALGDDKGKMIALVQARPFGGVLSMEVVDERGPEVKEYVIEPDLSGVNYKMSLGGESHSVYKNGNGLLALMKDIKELAPEEPKEEAPKEEPPKEESPKS